MGNTASLVFTSALQAISCRTCRTAIAECRYPWSQCAERGERRGGSSVWASDRSNIWSNMVGIDSRGTRMHLGLVPLLHRIEKGAFILAEQLLSLLCFLGLAGRLQLNYAGFGTNRETVSSRVPDRGCMEGPHASRGREFLKAFSFVPTKFQARNIKSKSLLNSSPLLILGVDTVCCRLGARQTRALFHRWQLYPKQGEISRFGAGLCRIDLRPGGRFEQEHDLRGAEPHVVPAWRIP